MLRIDSRSGMWSCCVVGAIVEWVVWWSYFVSLVIYENVEFWKLYSVGDLQSPAILALS